ncbi:uncharacterized protein N7479_004712 [Penicillium vulpinum]|uniref:uncharacterized protein n=1 Tax=Penicillium vulpinum TaxID=29845 RepID=UPI00254754A2|nr:uncharacterized protein N7479_004712 [Penicillium vulpinum]KAJ5964836.1 hypothetical protein N7479_004712 [Penicillium vulpinum]
MSSKFSGIRRVLLFRRLTLKDWLGNAPRIDLSEFTSLKALRIYRVFLYGADGQYGASPQSLRETDNTPYDTFLLGLITHKRTHLPSLYTVIIHSPEIMYDSEEGDDLPAGPWALPSSPAREAESAGIKLNVWLGHPSAGGESELDFGETDVLGSLKISSTTQCIQPSERWQ